MAGKVTVAVSSHWPCVTDLLRTLHVLPLSPKSGGTDTSRIPVNYAYAVFYSIRALGPEMIAAGPNLSPDLLNYRSAAPQACWLHCISALEMSYDNALYKSILHYITLHQRFHAQ